jgi:hypothetical protein
VPEDTELAFLPVDSLQRVDRVVDTEVLVVPGDNLLRAAPGVDEAGEILNDIEQPINLAVGIYRAA